MHENIYAARVPKATTREWSVAPVRIGFGLGPQVILLLYHPAKQLLLCLKPSPTIIHSFRCWFIASSTLPNFCQWCAIAKDTCFYLKKMSLHSSLLLKSSTKCKHTYILVNALCGIDSFSEAFSGAIESMGHCNNQLSSKDRNPWIARLCWQPNMHAT